MRNINKFIFVYLFLMLLSQCASVREDFSSNKKSGSDEFLVEKKAPLVMPPNYEELPIPNQDQGNLETEKNTGNIKNLIKKGPSNNSNISENSQTDNSLEKNILDKIKN
tara:strand:+ start:465 stop:791 length:327 start_codon:yes stop_codon:yes gene_type:complete